MKKPSFAALDSLRLAAAFLVVAIHTGPLSGLSPTADLVLTRVLARCAVPFFFMLSGYFLERGSWARLGHFCKKTLALYGVCILLYLPLNWYAGGAGPVEWARRLLFTGTFYHLWYLPAVLLGAVVARWLRRGGLRCALLAAAALYLVGLLGDSYYGFVCGWAPARLFYEGVFAVAGYARNGLFFAPLFLLLGASARRGSPSKAALGLLASLAAMTVESLWLHGLGVPRHDSMYLFLPLTMFFLFRLALTLDGRQAPRRRAAATLVYVLHPWCIVLVRGAAKLLGLRAWLVDNALLHTLCVCALSALLAFLLPALMPPRRSKTARAWREVDLAALRRNAAVLQGQLAPGCRLMAVVKADAYGHGAVAVARALQRQGVRAFAVACLAEGIRLRLHGVRGEILVLGYTQPSQARLLRFWRLSQALVDEAYAQSLAAAPGRGRLRVHLALDTGMHRLGIPAGQLAALQRVAGTPRFQVRGTFSHLCVADSQAPGDAAYTQAQLEQFYTAVHGLLAAGCEVGRVHIQASYGIWNLPPQPCGYARAGIALYGVGSDSTPVAHPLDLWPALSLRARVACVRGLQPGERAGYGLAFEAVRPTRLAVVAIGYADGMPRALGQNGGHVLLHGQRAPIVGRLCMDQLLADVTEIPGVQAGDTATLIGRDGGACLSAEELAAACGTITNELLARLGHRLDTVYLGR